MEVIKEKVSVIMATYNRAKFLPEAVESVLMQEAGDLELIIIDDGSTDNTKEVLRPYLNDDRVKYFYQENKGQMAASNYGFTLTDGEFICFLDSDNAWLPRKVIAQLNVLRSCPDVDIVYGDIVIIDENGNEVTNKNMKRHSGKITPHLLRDNCVSINTAMMRRHCYINCGGMDESLEAAADYDLWLRFSIHYKFLYIPEYYANYRVMAAQISTDKTKRFRVTEHTLTRFIENNKSTLSKKDVQAGLSTFYMRKSRYLQDTKNFRDAFKNSIRAIRISPFSIAVYRSLTRAVLHWLKSN